MLLLGPLYLKDRTSGTMNKEKNEGNGGKKERRESRTRCDKGKEAEGQTLKHDIKVVM